MLRRLFFQPYVDALSEIGPEQTKKNSRVHTESSAATASSTTTTTTTLVHVVVL